MKPEPVMVISLVLLALAGGVCSADIPDVLPTGLENLPKSMMDRIVKIMSTNAEKKQKVKFSFDETDQAVSQIQIANGQEADPNEYPWMAHIKVAGDFRCGGSLLAPSFVLTAKQCLACTTLQDVEIILGDHNRFITEGMEQERGVLQLHLHPSADLVIVELDSPVTITTAVSPIGFLPGIPGEGAPVTVIGWGVTQVLPPNLPTYATILQELEMPVAPNTDCNNEFFPMAPLTPSEFCAGEDNGIPNANVCQGDNGGPVMYHLGSLWCLVGVVTRGSLGCPTTGNFAAFLNIRDFHVWITQVTSVETHCFPGDAMLMLESGDSKRMDEVTPGDRVLALTPEGSPVYSDVIMMMHASHHALPSYLIIQTELDSVKLRISDEHLVYLLRSGELEAGYRFASSVQVGDFVYTTDMGKEGRSLKMLKVVKVSRGYYTGAFAPLTLEGTVVVDKVVASSYAYVESQTLCHLALWPVRLLNTWAPHLLTPDKPWTSPNPHWAPTLIQSIASPVF